MAEVRTQREGWTRYRYSWEGKDTRWCIHRHRGWLEDTRIIWDQPRRRLRTPWAGLDRLPLYSES